MTEQENRFIVLYQEVYNNQEVQPVGREKCQELITLGHLIDAQAEIGKEKTGFMNLVGLTNLYNHLIKK